MEATRDPVGQFINTEGRWVVGSRLGPWTLERFTLGDLE